MSSFPTPSDLWAHLQADAELDDSQANRLLTPYIIQSGKTPRYYQDVAINRVVMAALKGKGRILLTMATGTGKTSVAFQIYWELWESRWNLSGDHHRPKILALTDRNILVDDPIANNFFPFGDTLKKICDGEVIKCREMYFAIYRGDRRRRKPSWIVLGILAGLF